MQRRIERRFQTFGTSLTRMGHGGRFRDPLKAHRGDFWIFFDPARAFSNIVNTLALIDA